MAEAAKGKGLEEMFKNAKAFSSFSVSAIETSKEFYAHKLGLEVTEEEQGLGIKLSGGGSVFLYPKADHTPATFTVLNFHTDNIDETVNGLKSRGISFESYEGDIKTDEKGIFRGAEKGSGPNIAWFKDPSGNILSVVEAA